MKSDLLPTEEAEQLANALVLIGNTPRLYSQLVVTDFPEQTKGQYHAFRMFKRGQPFTVVVDSYLEC